LNNSWATQSNYLGLVSMEFLRIRAKSGINRDGGVLDDRLHGMRD